ncbi:hypothetical protein J6Z37_02375 [Candidatus Saccharibacteria bacterium]|nr:hypothetical protein [Candidatus Saccharibacteria bacterium]
MKPIVNHEYLGGLKNKNLLIDTTALVDASRDNKSAMLNYFKMLKSVGCGLVIIPDAYYEFIRGARTTEQRQKYVNFFNDLDILTVPLTGQILSNEENQRFSIAYSQEAKHASITDYMLCVALYHYRGRGMKLLTANHKDMPSSLLERESLIAYDQGDEIRTHAIYGIAPNERLAKTFKKYP